MSVKNCQYDNVFFYTLTHTHTPTQVDKEIALCLRQMIFKPDRVLLPARHQALSGHLDRLEKLISLLFFFSESGYYVQGI